MDRTETKLWIFHHLAVLSFYVQFLLVFIDGTLSTLATSRVKSS